MVSSASAPRSAIRSCADRARLRSRRPNTTSGSTTKGTTATTISASFGLVTTSMAIAPSASSADRSQTDTALPISDCSRAVSVVSRVSTSPVRSVSNTAGDSVSTRSNTAARMSAATRSPSQEIR